MTQKYRTPIYLSPHSIERWQQRVGKDKVTKIQGWLRRAVRSAIKSGMEVKNGAAVITVFPGVQAVVAPSLRGGWEIITVTSDLKIEVDGQDGQEEESDNSCDRCGRTIDLEKGEDIFLEPPAVESSTVICPECYEKTV